MGGAGHSTALAGEAPTGEAPAAAGFRPRYLAVPGIPLALLAVYLVALTFHGDRDSFWVDSVLGNVVLAVPAVVCLVRAVLTPARRAVFTLMGAACAAFLAGNVAYVAHVQYQDPVPYPSVADIGYLMPYPMLFAAVVVLAARELRGTSVGTWLDGLLSASACAAVGSVLTLRPVLAADAGTLSERIVGAAYPVADLTLAALIVAVVTLKGRPGLTWLCLGSGIVVFAVADTTYLYRLAENTYEIGTPLDGLWALGLNLLGVAAALPYHPGGRRNPAYTKSLVVPNVFCLVGVGVLIYGSLESDAMPSYVVALTVLTLFTALQRISFGFRALKLLDETQRQARTDELTQLSNRRHFDQQVQLALTSRRADEKLALLMIDLDGFKAINDMLGHQAGDELLRQIGPRLRGRLSTGDVLARLGGDEFGILLRNSDVGVALAVADELVAAVDEPFLLDGVVQTASASVGVALCPEHGTDLTVLLQHGDQAMFDAKTHGSRVTVYDPERLGGGGERFNVRDALAGRQLFLEYQPQIDDDGHMYGVEALVRWRHPDLGLVSPGRFLPFFEQAGLMNELTLHVLDLGARDWRRWRLDHGQSPRLSVNLAPSALLDDDLLGEITAILDRYGMPADMLTLEITESVPVAESERSVRTLHALVARGIELSLDDYGTGWAALSYLVDLPLDEVKIDRSFVMGLTPGTPQAAVVKSTIDLAAALGLRAVAEGVETPDELRTLRELGCRHFQGYLLGRPMPARGVPGHRPNTQVFRTQLVGPLVAPRRSDDAAQTTRDSSGSA